MPSPKAKQAKGKAAPPPGASAKPESPKSSHLSTALWLFRPAQSTISEVRGSASALTILRGWEIRFSSVVRASERGETA